MCMFNDDGTMQPVTYDEDGDIVSPTCDGCGKCGDVGEDQDEF